MLIRNYLKIGKKSDARKFLKALTNEKDYTSTNQKKNGELIDGAVQAFAEGRPENVQTAIANEGAVNYYYYPALVSHALFKITENSVAKLDVIHLALDKVSDKQAVLDKALKDASSENVGGDSFSTLLLQAKVFEFERLPEQNGEAIIRGALHTAIERGIGGEDFYVSLLKTGIARIPEQDRKKVLSETLNVAVAKNTSEAFQELLLKSGANANASIQGHPGGILVTATCAYSPMPVIELLHKNGASFDDALTTMHSQGYGGEDIERLRFFQEKLEGGKAAAAAIAAATKAVTVVEQSAAAEQGDVRDILLQILAQVKELTEYIKKDRPETPAASQDSPVQNKAGRRGNYPSL